MGDSPRLSWEARHPDFMGRPTGIAPVIEEARIADLAKPKGLARFVPQGLRRRVIERGLKMVESMGGGTLLGNWGVSDPDLAGGGRPLSQRIDAITRDLDALTYDRQIRMALYLFSTNLIAGWLVENLIDIVLGQRLGFTVKVDAAKAKLSDEAAQKLSSQISDHLNVFWKHHAHSLDTRAAEYGTTWLVTGALLLPATVNEADGIPMLDLIDAQQISKVESADRSAIVPGRVWYRPANSAGDPKPIEVIRPMDRDGDLAVGPYGADGKAEIAFYFPWRSLLNQLMGTSFLLRAIDWCDRHDQFMFAGLDRAKLTNNFAWWAQLEGRSQQECEAQAAKWKREKTFEEPGGLIVTNEKGSLNAVSPKLDAGDTDQTARTFRNHVLGAYSRPEHWYAEGGHTNRATGTEQSDVSYKALERIQERFRGMFETILHFAYDSGRKAQPNMRKGWPARSTGAVTISVEMPPIRERDYARVGAALGAIAGALQIAEEAELLSHDTSQRVFQLAAAKMGAEIDPSREKEQIDAEAKEREEEEAQAQAEAARRGYDRDLDDDGEGAGPRRPAGPPTGGRAREGEEASGTSLVEALAALAGRPAGEVHHHTHLPAVAVTAPTLKAEVTTVGQGEIARVAAAGEAIGAAAVLVSEAADRLAATAEGATASAARLAEATVAEAERPIVVQPADVNPTIVIPPASPPPVVVESHNEVRIPATLDVRITDLPETESRQKVERDDDGDLTGSMTTTRPKK
jgi:hypothetical protein